MLLLFHHPLHLKPRLAGIQTKDLRRRRREAMTVVLLPLHPLNTQPAATDPVARHESEIYVGRQDQKLRCRLKNHHQHRTIAMNERHVMIQGAVLVILETRATTPKNTGSHGRNAQMGVTIASRARKDQI